MEGLRESVHSFMNREGISNRPDLYVRYAMEPGTIPECVRDQIESQSMGSASHTGALIASARELKRIADSMNKGPYAWT